MADGQAPSRETPETREARPPGDPVAALSARLCLSLPDYATALAALTHKSYVNEHRAEEGLTDNERLEFLGDAVIDLAVSHRLMERFPTAREGDLSKMRAAVVDEQGLSEMARALDLGALLRLGRGEELTGGRQKASLLADAMARAASGTLDRDFKTQLQELAQSLMRATPRYRVVAEHGPDHSKTFEVETDVRGEVVGHGAGRSKKDAEQAAAKLALDALARRVVPPPAPAEPPAPALPEEKPAASAPPAAPAEAAIAPRRRAVKRARPAVKRAPRRAPGRAGKSAKATKGRGRKP